MRLLLDTHALLWYLSGNTILPMSVRDALDDQTNEAFVSAVSAMEVNTKHRLGKLPEADDLAIDFVAKVVGHGFALLPITVEHAAVAGSLAIDHKDPFDRLLIAQSQIEAMPLVSNEVRFDGYGVRRLW